MAFDFIVTQFSAHSVVIIGIGLGKSTVTTRIVSKMGMMPVDSLLDIPAVIYGTSL